MSFKVLSAENEKRLPAKGDRPELAVHRYGLEIDGERQYVERVAKLDTALPTVGSFIDGTIEQTNFGPRFKPTPKGGNFNGRGGGMTPEREKTIVRQHQTEMALRYIDLKARLGKITDFTFADVQRLTDAFVKDLEGSPAPQSDIPFNSAGLEEQTP